MMQFNYFLFIMNEINEYTVIVVYKWSIYGDDIKKIFNNHKLKLNPKKTFDLNYEDLKDTLKKFHLINNFEIYESVKGLSGIWETENIAIKIIKIENVDNIILIYKGDEEKLYIEFIKKCKDIGCLVIKIVNDEIMFKDRINIELIKKINDVNEEKNIKINNFITKIELIKGFSDGFKNKWINYIKI